MTEAPSVMSHYLSTWEEHPAQEGRPGCEFVFQPFSLCFSFWDCGVPPPPLSWYNSVTACSYKAYVWRDRAVITRERWAGSFYNTSKPIWLWPLPHSTTYASHFVTLPGRRSSGRPPAYEKPHPNQPSRWQLCRFRLGVKGEGAVLPKDSLETKSRGQF